MNQNNITKLVTDNPDDETPRPTPLNSKTVEPILIKRVIPRMGNLTVSHETHNDTQLTLTRLVAKEQPLLQAAVTKLNTMIPQKKTGLTLDASTSVTSLGEIKGSTCKNNQVSNTQTGYYIRDAGTTVNTNVFRRFKNDISGSRQKTQVPKQNRQQTIRTLGNNDLDLSEKFKSVHTTDLMTPKGLAKYQAKRDKIRIIEDDTPQSIHDAPPQNKEKKIKVKKHVTFDIIDLPVRKVMTCHELALLSQELRRDEEKAAEEKKSLKMAAHQERLKEHQVRKERKDARKTRLAAKKQPLLQAAVNQTSTMTSSKNSGQTIVDNSEKALDETKGSTCGNSQDIEMVYGHMQIALGECESDEVVRAYYDCIRLHNLRQEQGSEYVHFTYGGVKTDVEFMRKVEMTTRALGVIKVEPPKEDLDALCEFITRAEDQEEELDDNFNFTQTTNEFNRRLNQRAIGHSIRRRIAVYPKRVFLDVVDAICLRNGVYTTVEQADGHVEFGPLEQAKTTVYNAVNFPNTLTDLSNTVKGAVRNVEVRIGDVTDNVNNLAARAQDTMSSIGSALMDGIVQMREMLENLAPTVLGVTTLGSTLIKMFKLIALTAMAQPKYRVATFLLEVVTNFSGEMANFIKSAVTAVHRWFSERMRTGQQQPAEDRGLDWMGEHEPELDLDIDAILHGPHYPVEQVAGHNEALNDLLPNMTPDVVAPIIGVASAGILAISFGLPTGSLDACVNYFGKRCAALKNITSYFDQAAPIFEDVYNWLYKLFCGPLVDENISAILNGYENWALDVLAGTKPEALMTDKLSTDAEAVMHVNSLYEQGVDFQKHLNSKRIAPGTYSQFNKLMRVVEQWKQMADRSTALNDSVRTPPFILYMFGTTGVGKSGLTSLLADDFNQVYGTGKKTANEMYVRKVEQVFWDRYEGQLTTIYDDFGQIVDTTGNANPEFMEIIRCANVSEYPLHMAELEKKSKTLFKSKFVILSSNTAPHCLQPKSIVSNDALKRRFDLTVEVKIKPEFTKELRDERNNMITMLDPTKTPDDLSAVYAFDIVDAVSGTKLETDLEYEQLIEKILKGAKTRFEHGDKFGAFIAARAANAARVERIKGHTQVGESEENADRVVGFIAKRETNFLEAEAARIAGLIKTHDEALGSVEVESKELKENIKSWPTWFGEQLKEFGKLKSLLAAVSLVLGAVGVWKLFKSNRAPREYLNGVRMNTEVAQVIRETSGNPNTLRPRTVTRETSGNPNTLKLRTVVKETSGNPNTLKPRTLVRETSGNPNTTQPRKVVREMRKGKEIIHNAIQEMARDQTAQDLITNKVLTNTYKITRVRDGERRALLNGVFVVDRVMLTARHLMTVLLDTDQLEIENIHGAVHTVPVSDLTFTGINARDGTEKDAMLIEFSNKINCHSTLLKHFATGTELVYTHAKVCMPTMRHYNGKLHLAILGNAKAIGKDIDIHMGDSVYQLREGYEYDLNTQRGDCGSLVIFQEHKCQRKIAGIHVAAVDDGNRAFAQSVTAADLERALAGKELIVVDHDELPHLQSANNTVQIGCQYDQDQIRELLDLPAPTFGFAGYCAEPVFNPSKTDLRPSKISGQVTQPITRPAILYAPGIDIMGKNVAKQAMPTPSLDTDLIEKCAKEVEVELMKGSDRTENIRRVLTFEEGIAGNRELNEHLEPINRSSSPGYPWVLQKKPGCKGKSTWCGDDDYVFDEDLRKIVEHRISCAKQGRRLPTVWTDTLKDERRPHAKVDAMKTRVFASGPLDYLVAFRMLFLSFNAHLMTNRIENEQSIGTNPFGHDWTRTAKKLQKFGPRVIAGDFSSFDGTLNTMIMMKFVDVANAWYDDGPELALARKTLFLDVVNATHLCEGIYYTVDHSQPSGNPATTVLNSFYNSVSMRMCFYMCAKEAGEDVKFAERVSMVSFGDDNVVNISPQATDYFNQQTITTAYAQIGMTYTDEAKTTGVTPAYRTLGEVAYLKRGFVCDKSVWYCPMELEAVLETANWVRTAPDEDDACLENCANVIQELAQHDKATFDKYSVAINRACRDAFGRIPNQETYREYRAKQANLD
uniref:Nonstructural polyprotein n=1 Tax=Soybean thrips picorna-like virus 10 TaxID=2796571 RepID=A0A7T3R0K7_9VIRU|nr:nonstructural polyprotein [Soybean thrips picorna-like virus 10]